MPGGIEEHLFLQKGIRRVDAEVAARGIQIAAHHGHDFAVILPDADDRDGGFVEPAVGDHPVEPPKQIGRIFQLQQEIPNLMIIRAEMQNITMVAECNSHDGIPLFQK